MKFLHLGDLHIGKSLGDFDLLEDQEFILEQIITIAKHNNVDAVLVAGDVYDRAIPSEAAVKLFDSFICRLVDEKIKTFIISGNHDSDERLNFGSSLFTTNNIYISAKYNGVLYRHTLEDEFGEVNVYLLPFVKASQVRRFFPGETIEAYDDAVRVVLNNSGIDKTKRNVLVAHQYVAGKLQEPQLAGSEGLAVKNVGTIEKIGVDCFDMFDYVALGHIHSGQRIGRDEVRYAGSPLKYSLSEVNHKKSVPIITMGNKGDIDIELVQLHPRRDVRHIKGKMENLLDKSNVLSTEDFIYVTLTDENIINDAMGIFQQVYPNTVKIDYDNSHTREIDIIDVKQITKGRPFEEVISDFYLQMYGCDISAEEMKVMNDIAREVGVLDETN